MTSASSNQNSPGHDWLTNDADENRWDKKRLFFPRLALKVSRLGVRQQLIMPGTYETRISRSMGRRVYRDPAG